VQRHIRNRDILGQVIDVDRPSCPQSTSRQDASTDLTPCSRMVPSVIGLISRPSPERNVGPTAPWTRLVER
jgi:hypothetical protein